MLIKSDMRKAMLELMYITNNPDVAVVAQRYGVDRIFVDMEYIGKDKRQGGMDTVQNHHTVQNVRNIKSVLTSSKLQVRINPFYEGTENEVNSVIEAGADIIMLPMWKTAEEVSRFISLVNGRAKTLLLLENTYAMNCLDEVLELDGVDEIHIGLNDLHLSMGKKFLFELLADGTVEKITKKIAETDIPYGFGGFGRIGYGFLPADYIVAEHYRLGSSMSILSRAFCNTNVVTDKEEIEYIFKNGMKDLRSYEEFLKTCDENYFDETHKKLCACVEKIVGEM